MSGEDRQLDVRCTPDPKVHPAPPENGEIPIFFKAQLGNVGVIPFLGHIWILREYVFSPKLSYGT